MCENEEVDAFVRSMSEGVGAVGSLDCHCGTFLDRPLEQS